MKKTLKYRVYLMVFIIGFFLVKPGIGVGEAPEAEFLLQWGEKVEQPAENLINPLE